MSQVCRHCGKAIKPCVDMTPDSTGKCRGFRHEDGSHFCQRGIGKANVAEPADDTGGELCTCETRIRCEIHATPKIKMTFAQCEPAPSADGQQREIDISNLRFYARMFREYKWETDVLSWTVFEHTLKTIADRLAAPAPVSGEGRE